MAPEPALRSRRALTTAGVAAKNAALAAGEPYLELRADNDDDLQIVRLPDDRRQISFGRNAESDVPLAWDGQVSWTHARLERVDDEWMVEDQGSTNGSFVNRTRLHYRRRLVNGDRLQFGDTQVVFHDPRPARPPATLKTAARAAGVVLTEEQRRVLVELCRPLNDDPACVTPMRTKEIAEALNLPEATVKSRLKVLYARFDLQDLEQNAKRQRLAHGVLESGLLTHHDF